MAGRPRRVPDGLNEVIYVRADKALMKKLDRIHKAARKSTGFPVSRADIVRKLIEDAADPGIVQDHGGRRSS